MSKAEELFNELRSKGMSFRYEDGKLRYSGPKGIMNDEYLARLKECRDELIQLINEDKSSAGDTISRVHRDGPLELSFAQQQLWFLYQLAGPSYVYNLPLGLKFYGKLDINALKHAAESLVQRHDALSTSFIECDFRPVMIVHEKVDVPFRIEDISNIPENKRSSELDLRLRDEASALFDLSHAPLFRCMLVILGNDEYVFLVTCHHITSDGWSMGIVINDLAHFYNSETQGTPISLPQLPVQYADFAAWQRKSFSADKINAEIEFWKNKLRGIPDLCTMPLDKPRPSIQSFAGDTVSFTIPSDLTSQLRQRAGKMKTTLNVLLTSAFGLVLSRYSGQNDIILGIALANRLKQELEPLVGMFVNTLPLRLDFSGRCPFSEYVSRTSKASMELLRHSQVPFERLVDELEVPRELSRQAVFQTAFTLLPPLGNPPEFTNLKSEWLQIQSDIAKLDISLYIEETGDALTCLIEYATALFNRESVTRWMRSFSNLLKTVANNPDILIDESVVISSEDRKLLSDWSTGNKEQIPDTSVLELFRKHVSEKPDSMAIIGESSSMTYHELDRFSDEITSVLKKEDFVGVCMTRSPDAVAAMLAVLKNSSAFIPLDSNQPLERLKYMIENSNLKTVLADKETMKLVKGISIQGLNVINVTSLPAGKTAVKKQPHADYSPEFPAYVIYTSGSTGQPKGVVIPHKGLLNMIRWHTKIFDISQIDIISQGASLSFDASIIEIWPVLCSGACLHLIPADIIFDPMKLRDWIVANKITVHFCSSAIAEILIKLDWEQNCALRILYTGGDVLRVRPSHGLPFKTYNLYGPTENSVASTLSLLSPEGDMPPEIGKPLFNINCHVLRENNNLLVPVLPGAFGELYLSGEGLALEYLNDPERTAQSFLYWSPETFLYGKEQSDNIRVYKTGDLVRYRHDGNLEFAGRTDNQVKIRGFRIELGEIENALKRHPQVEDAIVITYGETVEDKRLIAFVKNKEVSGSDKSGLLSHLKKILPSYMLPADIIAVKEFPLLPSGKINRKSLAESFREKPAAAKATLPENKLMKTISAVWEKALGVSSPGIEENFFDLGGHSLLLIKVRDLLRQQGCQVDIMDLFRYPTIAALSDFLETGKKKVSISEIPSSHVRAGDDIAIIGMAGRFPGADDINSFWDNLVAGKESISFFTKEQLLEAGVPEDLVLNPSYVPANGILKDIEFFDADFFSISPAEARMIDPQQRLLLETAWEAFENAGWDPGRYPKRIGVFIGTSLNSYLTLNVLGSEAYGNKPLTAFLAGGQDFAATRIAYKLNLRGPAVNVANACSTSMVTVNLAIQSLLDGYCEMALAGGATVHPRQIDGYLYEEASVLSPDGHCRAFDAEAKGFVGGNGVGLVLLKRLEDALSDADHIYAVIKAVAMNNDGSEKIGFTAPSITGQAEVIRSAQKSAGVDPRSISYIEAHGTGTPIGDPIEISALREVFGEESEKKYCAVGSVKTNIGHLDSAAGIAGLIKTALSLKHRMLPKSLHFQRPNPQLNLDKGPFYINSSTQTWQTDLIPRRAGISSFGMGGTNVHAILEEAVNPPAETSGRPVQIIPVSAKNETALGKLNSKLADFLEQYNDLNLADIAFSLAAGRKAFPSRRAFVAASLSDAVRKLRSSKPLNPKPLNPESKINSLSRRLSFMFTGQGSQYTGMGRELLKEPVFKQNIERCSELLKPHLNFDIRDIIWPETESSEAAQKLRSTSLTQPALFVFEYALSQLWLDWGIVPDSMIGHSIGEWVAACLSGVFSLEDSLRLVAMRGQVMEEQAPGKMLAVALPETEIKEYLRPELSLATVNTPRQCVLSGPESDINELMRILKSRNIRATKLDTSHAFHSPMMEPAMADMTKAVAAVERSSPKIPFISNITADWITPEQAVSPEYWARHIRETVRFSDGLKTLLAEQNLCLLEIGSRRILGNMVPQSPTYNAGHHLVLASLGNTPDISDFSNLAETAADLWNAGFNLKWESFYRHERRKRVPLPSTPFERKKCWIEAAGEARPGRKVHVAAVSTSGFETLAEELKKHESELWHSLHLKLLADTPEFISLVNRLCGAYARRLMTEALPGIKPGDRINIDAVATGLGAAPALHRLIEAHLRIIEEDGLARRDEKGLILLKDPADADNPDSLLKEGIKTFPDFADALRFVHHCAGHNEAVLRGKASALEVLFPSDTSFVPETEDSPDEHHLYSLLCRELLSRMIKNKSGVVRVIEIGAGTGMLTEVILPAITGNNVEYFFTDISQAFVNSAKRHFKDPALNFAILDISREPAGQGYTPASFDLVLALNVIHATPDLKHTLNNLRSLLAPGGIIAIIEEVRSSRWMDLTWGLTDGWWSYTDLDLRKNGPLISSDKWKEVLIRSGFSKAAAFPENTEFARRSDCGLIMGYNDIAESAVIAKKSVHAAPRRRQAISSTAAEKAEKETAHLIAQAMAGILGLEQVNTDDDFFSLGGDSLLALQLCSNLKRDYGIELPHSALLQASTASGLVSAVKNITASSPEEIKDFSTSGCLIPMRKGNPKAPSFFLVHPVGGGVLCYRDFLSFLSPEYPVFGLQSPGLLDKTHPLKDIRVMAEHYIEAIRNSSDSSSNRVLIGHSFGGLVVFEMSRLLDKLGEKPLLTVLIDAPGPGYMPKDFKRDEELMAYSLTGDNPDKNWEKILGEIDALPEKERQAYFLAKSRELLPELTSTSFPEEAIIRSIHITKLNLKAMQDYSAEPWNGKILFLKAEERDKFSVSTPELAWIPLAKEGIEIIPVPGNHISMLSSPHVSRVTKEIEERVRLT